MGKVQRKIKREIDYIMNRMILKKNNVSYDKTLKINGRIVIIGKENDIKIGKNTIINSGQITNPIGGNTTTMLYGKIDIGNNVGISNTTITAFSGVEIEDNVFIGGDTKIYDTDFHSIEYEYRMESPDTHKKIKNVKICEGAFIGAHSIILKGVTIGRKSIIGAGSVVTKSVPDGEIWAGNPAKFIRKI